MDLLTLTLLYAVVLVALVFVLLFGEWRIFRGTPVSWCHWFVTSGIWEALLYPLDLPENLV